MGRSSLILMGIPCKLLPLGSKVSHSRAHSCKEYCKTMLIWSFTWFWYWHMLFLPLQHMQCFVLTEDDESMFLTSASSMNSTTQFVRSWASRAWNKTHRMLRGSLKKAGMEFTNDGRLQEIETRVPSFGRLSELQWASSEKTQWLLLILTNWVELLRRRPLSERNAHQMLLFWRQHKQEELCFWPKRRQSLQSWEQCHSNFILPFWTFYFDILAFFSHELHAALSLFPSFFSQGCFNFSSVPCSQLVYQKIASHSCRSDRRSWNGFTRRWVGPVLSIPWFHSGFRWIVTSCDFCFSAADWFTNNCQRREKPAVPFKEHVHLWYWLVNHCQEHFFSFCDRSFLLKTGGKHCWHVSEEDAVQPHRELENSG